MPSDSPKWIALVLSVVAIVASTLSWLEARQNRIINREVNRPFFSFSSTQIATFRDRDQSYILGLQFSLKNEGKTQAQVFKATVNAKLDERTKAVVKDCNLHTGDSTPQQAEVFPGTEQYFSFDGSLSAPCGKGDVVSIELTIKLDYKDSGTGSEYSQAFVRNVELLERPKH